MISGWETKKSHNFPPCFCSAAPSQHLAFLSHTELMVCVSVCVCEVGNLKLNFGRIYSKRVTIILSL